MLFPFPLLFLFCTLPWSIFFPFCLPQISFSGPHLVLCIPSFSRMSQFMTFWCTFFNAFFSLCPVVKPDWLGFELAFLKCFVFIPDRAPHILLWSFPFCNFFSVSYMNELVSKVFFNLDAHSPPPCPPPKHVPP